MSYTDRHIEASVEDRKAPLLTLMLVSVVIALALTLASFLAFGSAVVPLVLFLCANVVIGHGFVRTYPHASVGACNVVTLARAGMVAFLIGAVFSEQASAWLVAFVALTAFCLDGVDGWLARWRGLISGFGARFDMETDAALAAVLAIWLLSRGVTGVEVLVLGFARYLFVLAGLAVPKLTRDLPPSFRRKAICVVQIAALLALVFPLTPDALRIWLSVGAALLLLWSFAVDTIWLLRRPT